MGGRVVSNGLQVYLNGVLVGKLTKESGALSFEYNGSWLAQDGARPISLSLPLRDKSYTGDLVFNFFDNLLPDNPQIRARIQSKFQAKTSHPYDLLSEIGKDCIGAIGLASSKLDFERHIACEPLNSEEIANVLQNYRQAPLGMLNIEDHFRISMAGAQEKAAFLSYNKRWNRPLGSTPTTHIFKLPIGFLEAQQIDLSESCENEHLSSLILDAFGLPVAKTTVECFDKTKTLIVERFDRRYSSDKQWIMRLPQEDMCQALGVSPNLKYQADGGPGIIDIMKLLKNSANAAEDCTTFMKSQIVFYLLAAIDGHAKNFSVFIEPSGSYRLTPLYDVMSAYPLIQKKQLHEKKVTMAMALIGKNKHYLWHTILRRHFLSTADKVGFSVNVMQSMLDECIAQIPSVIATVSAQLPADFPSDIANSMFEGMQKAGFRLQR